jgi:hypothetical protein
MSAAGIPNPQIGQCWDSSNASIGATAGEAKQWLQQHATKGSNISCLNTDFAEKLKKLMSAVPGSTPTIRDGYRSPETQANLPAGSTRAGACQSYHQYGMAADIDASSETLLWMRRNSASFGLAPVSRCAVETGRTCDNKFSDPGHIQIAGDRPSKDQCGICSTASKGSGRVLDFSNPKSLASKNPPINAEPDDVESPSSCTPQLFCQDNIVTSLDGTCSTQPQEYCPLGCSNGACVRQNQGLCQTDATTIIQCNQTQQQQLCQVGNNPPVMVACNQVQQYQQQQQQMQQQAQQQIRAAQNQSQANNNGGGSVGGSSGTQTQSSTSNTPENPFTNTQTPGTLTGTDIPTASPLSFPALLPNLFKNATTSSSTLDILNALGNPRTTTPQTPSGTLLTPITLNGDASTIATLQIPRAPDGTPLIPGVTYARPASSFFSPSGEPTVLPSDAPNPNTPTQLIPTVRPNNADTFTSPDLGRDVPVTSFGAPGSTFTSNIYAVINSLKGQLQSILKAIRGQ